MEFILWICDYIRVLDFYIDAYTLSLIIACCIYVFYSYSNCIKYLQDVVSFLAVLVRSIRRCKLNLCTRGAIKGVYFGFCASPHVI